MRIITLLTLVWVLVTATVARADEAESKKLFDEGLALQNAGKATEACAKFQKAYEIDTKDGRPSAGTQLNLAACAENEGQLRKAYLLFDNAAQEYDRRAKAAEATLAKDPNSAEAKTLLDRANAGKRLSRERADALALKLAKVVVRIVEPGIDGLSVRVGDRAVPPAAEVIEHLDPGNITITASAPGRETFTTSAKAESGKSVVVEIPALRLTGGGKVEKPKSNPVAPRNKTRVRIAYGLGGGGLVALGVSGVFALKAKSQYDKAKDSCGEAFPSCTGPEIDEIDKAGKKADIATIFSIGGLGLVAGAAIVFITAPREGLVVSPMASPSGGGVTVRGRF